jgi:hypothetical protein
MTKNKLELDTLIKQTHPELDREHHLWACNKRALTMVAEILAHRALTPAEILALSKDAKSKGFLRNNAWVQEPANLIKLAGTHLGVNIKVQVHNTEPYNLAKIDANPTAFWRLEYATGNKNAPTHFVLLLACGTEIDPYCPKEASYVLKTSGQPVRMRRIDACLVEEAA